MTTAEEGCVEPNEADEGASAEEGMASETTRCTGPIEFSKLRIRRLRRVNAASGWEASTSMMSAQCASLNERRVAQGSSRLGTNLRCYRIALGICGVSPGAIEAPSLFCLSIQPRLSFVTNQEAAWALAALAVRHPASTSLTVTRR